MSKCNAISKVKCWIARTVQKLFCKQTLVLCHDVQCISVKLKIFFSFLCNFIFIKIPYEMCLFMWNKTFKYHQFCLYILAVVIINGLCFRVVELIYRIHSNKCPGGLIILDGRLFVSIFIARIDPKVDDFAHFQANSQPFWT